MKKIRQSVFETNSSSTHSISISENNSSDLMDVLIPNEDGNVVLNGGEFGWNIRKYANPEDKASYMAIYAIDWSGDRSDEFVEIFKDVIKEQTGCNDVIFNFSTGCDDSDLSWSYIDHQSVESQDYHYLFYDRELLRQFIFNKESYLLTDNDNR